MTFILHCQETYVILYYVIVFLHALKVCKDIFKAHIFALVLLRVTANKNEAAAGFGTVPRPSMPSPFRIIPIVERIHSYQSSASASQLGNDQNTYQSQSACTANSCSNRPAQE